MLKERDKKLLVHVENYHAITIYQAYQLFYCKNDRGEINKYGHDIATKRLYKLEHMGILKSYKNPVSSEKVYYLDRRISPHNLILLNFYSALSFYGADIKEFKVEPVYMEGKVRPDGFIHYSYKGNEYICLIEVDFTHSTKLEKYVDLWNTSHFQDKYGAFPLIVVICADNSKYTCSKKEIEIEYLDYKMSGINEKVLA